MTEDNDVFLTTERLVLRRLREEDAEPLAGLWSDPRVTEYLGGPRDYRKVHDNVRAEAIAGESDPYDLWSLIERETGKVIGHCGLLEKEVDGRAEVEVVYVLSYGYWGCGYASEIALALRDFAVSERGLRRVIALIEPGHEASARVAEKAGLSLERETIRSNGMRRDVYAWECDAPVRE